MLTMNNKVKGRLRSVSNCIKKATGIKPILQKPIYIFCHHKCGTVLFGKVFRDICREMGWKFVSYPGKVKSVACDADVVLFMHSLVDEKILSGNYRGIHIIRDPRDIIISGYLYHKRTGEDWCVNKDFSRKKPIMFPAVPFSLEYRSEEWKNCYLDDLNGKSYQDTLLSMSENEGINFEMDHYGKWTIDDMISWNYSNDKIVEVKFEEIMDDYDLAFERIFSHLDFDKEKKDKMIELSKLHDLSRKSDREVKKIGHVSSRNTRRWESYFNGELKQQFCEKFADSLVKLGYEKSNNW